MLQSMGWQRVGHDLATGKQQSYFDFSSTSSFWLEEGFCGQADNSKSCKEIQTSLQVWLVEMERRENSAGISSLQGKIE